MNAKTIINEVGALAEETGELVAIKEASRLSRRASLSILSAVGVSTEWLTSKKGKLAVALLCDVAIFAVVYFLAGQKQSWQTAARMSLASKIERLLGDRMSTAIAAFVAIRTVVSIARSKPD